MVSKRILHCVFIIFLFSMAVSGMASAEETRNIENGGTAFVSENISISGATSLICYNSNDAAINAIYSTDGIFVLNESSVRTHYGRYYYSNGPSGGEYIDIYYPEISLQAELTMNTVTGATSGDSVDGKTINKNTNVTFLINTPKIGPEFADSTKMPEIGAKIVFTTPFGGKTTFFGREYGDIPVKLAQNNAGHSAPGTNSAAGTWTAQAEYTKYTPFADGSVKKSNTVSFTVQSIYLTITAAKDSVVRSNPFTVTIQGDSNQKYNVTIENLVTSDVNPTLQPNQEGWIENIQSDNTGVTGAVFTTDTSGKRSIHYYTTPDTKDKTYTIRVEAHGDSTDYDSVKVKVEKGAVTITASGDGNYLIDQEIKLTGTNTDSSQIFLFLTGQNLATNGIVLKNLPTKTDAYKAANPVAVRTDNTWEYKWDTTNSGLEADTYIIYATSRLTNGKSTEAKEGAVKLSDAEYATASITLNYPQLSVFVSPTNVLQGKTLTVCGVCSDYLSPSPLAVYLVGPEKISKSSVTVDNNGYYETSIVIGTDLPSAVYCVVVERPGPDGTSGNLSDAALREIIRNPSDNKGKYAVTEVVVGEEATIPPSSASGNVTIETSPNAVHIGETLSISGRNTGSNKIYLFLTGSNLAKNGIVLKDLPTKTEAHLATNPVTVNADNTWEYKWDTSNSALDTGTYTIYATDRLTKGKGTIGTNDAVPILEAEYASTTVELKMPYLTMAPSDYYVQRGDSISIKGFATGNPELLAYYLFGPKTYIRGTIPVASDGSYEIIIPTNEQWVQTQYYLVIEHPMYNDELNIVEAKTDIVTTLAVKPFYPNDRVPAPIIVEGTGKLQGPNAANALINLIDSANIDDIYGKYTFIVYQDTIPESPSVNDDGSVNQLTREITRTSFTPSGNLKPGESATGTVDIKFLKDASIYHICLGSELNSPVWSVSIADGWGGKLTFPEDMPNYIDGWLLSRLPGDVTLTLTSRGTVPDKISKKISLLTAVEINPSENILFHYASPKQLIVTEGAEVSATLPLSKGWNFISIPKTLASGGNSAEKLFTYVDTGNHQILGYDAEMSAWKPVLAADIVKPLNGYWIYAQEPTNLMLSFTTEPSVPATKTIYPGWNAVGLSAEEQTDARNAFAGTTWRTAIPWNLDTGVYGTAVINGGTGNSDPTVNLLQPEWGYWLYVEEQGKLTGMTV